MALSFRLKFILSICGSLVLTVAFIVSLLSYRHFLSIKSGYRTRVQSIARVVSALIDVRDHDFLRTKEDMKDPQYLAMIHMLNQILLADPSIKYIYTLRPSKIVDGQPLGFEFVLDGGAAGKVLDVSNFDFSALGDPYPSLPPEGSKVFMSGHPDASQNTYTDKWGTFMSGYAPLKDANGKTTAIVGVDVRASDIDKSVNSLKRIVWMVVGGTVGLCLFLTILLKSLVLKPIDKLVAATQSIIRGNLEDPIKDSRRDEFGRVFKIFNFMREKLKESQTRIAGQSKLNAQLETAIALQKHLFNWKTINSSQVKLGYFIKAADSICGDWSHYFMLNERYIYLVCSDVTGHGIGSGIVSSAVAGGFESLKSLMSVTGEAMLPDKILAHLNHVVRSFAREEFLMSMVVGLIDLQSGEFIYANAAHLPIALCQVKATGDQSEMSLKWLLTPGELLGSERFLCENQKFLLEPGDGIALFSDGLIERQNLNGKTYGRRHLERKLKSVSWEDPKEIVKAVLDDVDKFVEGLTLDALEDDVSLIVVVIPRTATFLRVDKAG